MCAFYIIVYINISYGIIIIKILYPRLNCVENNCKLQVRERYLPRHHPSAFPNVR